MKINLPQRIEVDDYHEFQDMERILRIVIPDINVTEIGCTGRYIGMIHRYSRFDPENEDLYLKLKQEVKDFQ